MSTKKIIVTLLALSVLAIGATGCTKDTTTESTTTSAETTVMNAETEASTTETADSTVISDNTDKNVASDSLSSAISKAYQNLDEGTKINPKESLSYMLMDKLDIKKAMAIGSETASFYIDIETMTNINGSGKMRMAFLGDKFMMYSEADGISSVTYSDPTGMRVYNNIDKTVMTSPAAENLGGGDMSSGVANISSIFDDEAIIATSNVVNIEGSDYTFERFSDKDQSCYVFDADGDIVFVQTSSGTNTVNAFTNIVPDDAFVEPTGYTAVKN